MCCIEFVRHVLSPAAPHWACCGVCLKISFVSFKDKLCCVVVALDTHLRPFVRVCLDICVLAEELWSWCVQESQCVAEAPAVSVSALQIMLSFDYSRVIDGALSCVYHPCIEIHGVHVKLSFLAFIWLVSVNAVRVTTGFTDRDFQCAK